MPGRSEHAQGQGWSERLALGLLRRYLRRRPRTAKRVMTDAGEIDVVGAQVCVVNDGRVLVQFRPFPPGWELPGGHVDADEEPAETAAREALEECGLTVRITGLVGVYTWQGLRKAGDAVYRADLVSGTPRRSLEQWATRWVRSDELPRTSFPWIQQRIDDALHGDPAHPLHRMQRVELLHVLFFMLTWVRWLVDGARRWRSRRR